MVGTIPAGSVVGWAARVWRAAALQIVLVLLTLVAIELLLRAVDLRYLRLGDNELVLPYAYDPELGWFPIPNSNSVFVGKPGHSARAISVHNNSLGLRDIEHGNAPEPTILVLGDSFVWGYEVEADERLTEFLRKQLPGYRIVNAGVAGYGTDQEYLLLQRLWDHFKPNAVVLIMFYNDHEDNTTNLRNSAFKPYLRLSPQGGDFQGRPVPRSRYYHFKDSWFAQNSWLVRVGMSAYVELRHRVVFVPDPTERLVAMMRDFVEARGARFLIGELDGKRLVNFFQTQKIPYVSLDEPPGRDDLRYRMAGGLGHWTPAGHAEAGAAILRLLRKTGVAPAGHSVGSERALPAGRRD